MEELTNLLTPIAWFHSFSKSSCLPCSQPLYHERSCENHDTIPVVRPTGPLLAFTLVFHIVDHFCFSNYALASQDAAYSCLCPVLLLILCYLCFSPISFQTTQASVLGSRDTFCFATNLITLDTIHLLMTPVSITLVYISPKIQSATFSDIFVSFLGPLRAIYI